MTHERVAAEKSFSDLFLIIYNKQYTCLVFFSKLQILRSHSRLCCSDEFFKQLMDI